MSRSAVSSANRLPAHRKGSCEWRPRDWMHGGAWQCPIGSPLTPRGRPLLAGISWLARIPRLASAPRECVGPPQVAKTAICHAESPLRGTEAPLGDRPCQGSGGQQDPRVRPERLGWGRLGCRRGQSGWAAADAGWGRNGWRGWGAWARHTGAESGVVRNWDVACRAGTPKGGTPFGDPALAEP